MFLRPIVLASVLGGMLLANADTAGAQRNVWQSHLTPTCAASALRGTVTLQGAAGQRVGAASLTNHGSRACTLRGTPRVTIVGPNGQALPVRQGAGPSSPPSGIELVPGQHTDVSIGWSNYCGTDPGMTHLVMHLPAGGTLAVYAGGIAGSALPIPPCLGPGQPSTLGVGAFLPPIEDPANGLLEYYDRINTRRYDEAYALLAGAKPTFRAFTLGYADTAHVTIDLVATPLYRIIRNGTAYACVGVHFRALKTNGSSTSYGGWYLTDTWQSINVALLPSQSVIRVNSALLLPSRAVCTAHVP